MNRALGLAGLVGVCCGLLVAACRSTDSLQKASDAVFGSYHEAVSATVADVGRAEALHRLGSEVEVRLRQEARTLAGLHRRLAELNAHYDTPRGELEAYLAAIRGRRQAIRDLLVAARAEAIDLATPSEWVELQQRRQHTLIDWFGDAPERF